jgi:hypothetical protein
MKQSCPGGRSVTVPEVRGLSETRIADSWQVDRRVNHTIAKGLGNSSVRPAALGSSAVLLVRRLALLQTLRYGVVHRHGEALR